MKPIVGLNLLFAIVVAATGCAVGADGEGEAESVAESSQAVTKSAYFWDGATLFKPFQLSQNCTLTVETTDGTSQRDPVLALVINSGSLGWGSATVPCRHGTYTATDGFNTLAFNNNQSGTNYNAKVSYKSTAGGSPLTVFAVGFLDATNQGGNTYFGNLNVRYSITGCADTSKNLSATNLTQDFHASGIQGQFPGYAYTAAPRPGGPHCANDTVLFAIDPSINGYGQCNDDCPTPLGGELYSCISNSSGANLWWTSPGFYSSGPDTGFTSVNNP